MEEFKSKLKKILSEKKINLIIFGETHGFFEDNKVQKEIIKLFKPSIFVYEMLEETALLTQEDKEAFLSKPDNESFSVISDFKELKQTVNLAKEHNLPIIGNDIKDMCRKDKEFLNKTQLTQEEILQEQEILEKRENKQSEVILSLLDKQEKVFATTGAFHLRSDSPLLKIDNAKPYLLVYFTYGGEQLFEPPEDFDESKVSLEIKEIN